ncbi:uroporphyrinogen-III C-methyltransferase [Rhodoferax sp.]|uniref:uroporphyrinogen-III C-methyltransferase n=1 Tax=Rhodoferax sp. TaxID=50421 RepID=UPI00261B565C|nr:uroporphyrinogen-III C-methyltransferase [Rhodoferax sp.]MDD2918335.1 uroporphyrinogen-III C-methyltransferase [Rhodoferax sp.]
MNPELPPESANPPSPAEPSASATSTTVGAAAKSAPAARWAVWPSAVLAVLALLTVALLWQKVTGMQEQLARQSAETQSQSSEARALAKQAVSLAQEAAARAAVLDSRLSEVALQRSQLDELMQSMSRSRDENLVVDIEAALRLAQQQAQLTGSVEPMLAALKSADQRIVRAAQPRLALLQRAIARDIDRVKASAVSDTPTLLIKLDELVHLADELVLANAVAPARQVEKNLVVPPKAPVSWWQTGFQMVLGEARNLVRVSRIESPDAALLSPEQSFFLRENLKLKLLNARLGLLARQIESARSDLADAEAMLKKYFQSNARKTQAAAALLQQLQTQMRTLQLPRIDETLAVLATAVAGR